MRGKQLVIKCDQAQKNRIGKLALDPVQFQSALTLADSEHLRAAGWTYALSRWFAVLHGYSFGISHFPLSTALNAIGLHIHTSSRGFTLTLDHFTSPSQA